MSLEAFGVHRDALTGRPGQLTAAPRTEPPAVEIEGSEGISSNCCNIGEGRTDDVSHSDVDHRASADLYGISLQSVSRMTFPMYPWEYLPFSVR